MGGVGARQSLWDLSWRRDEARAAEEWRWSLVLSFSLVLPLRSVPTQSAIKPVFVERAKCVDVSKTVIAPSYFCRFFSFLCYRRLRR